MTDSTQKKPVGRNVHQHLHATRVQIGAPFCKIVGRYIIMPNISTPYHTTIPFLANYSADRLTYVHQKAHTVCSWQTYSLPKKSIKVIPLSIKLQVDEYIIFHLSHGSWESTSQQQAWDREWTTSGMRHFTLKTDPQWHTFSSKTALPITFQTASTTLTKS